MLTSPVFGSADLLSQTVGALAVDHAYEGLTIAAMIVLLGTLWAF